ncbi:S-layer homology domain-containing protein [Paenibacillus eucommiae]|uniref:SLH domain-containing protein n=1 Tax=Paenibacillus eucommiae TaxID=1355755 RepID=A0ABS4J1N1_9BACL|nr:S-layer homology domain-containing protein [Paenibacillus eucommiae]MBP1993235.1 hypothetical protein [Paenibacillus eucommiae]
MIIKLSKKKMLYRVLSSVIIFTMLFSSLTVPAKAADPDPDQIVYDFRKIAFPDETTGFTGQEAQPGWSLVDAHDVPPVLGYQPDYGLNIGSFQVGMSRSFLFDVPETGQYLVKFKALVLNSGGIGELQIDDQPIGTYDFYSATTDYVTKKMRIMTLAKGTHTLKLVVVGRSPGSAEGTGGHRMSASEFTIQKMEEPPMIENLVISSSNPDLYVGSESQLSAYGIGNDGTPIDLGDKEVTYVSENPAVVNVNHQTGSLIAVDAGETIVTASVNNNGSIVSQTLLIKVKSRAGNDPIVYDFRNVGFPDQPFYVQPGWGMVGLPTDIPVLGFDPSNGINIGTTRIGQNRSFHFDVPETGIYLVEFRGQKYSIGGIVELQIDGRPIGTFDSYLPAWSLVTEPIRLLKLDKGQHTLTLQVVGKHEDAPDDPAYRISPSEFVLAMVDASPALSDVSLFIEDSELYVGSTSQLKVSGTTENGIPSDVFDTQVSYGSDNTGVVIVDALSGKLKAAGVGSTLVTVSVENKGQTLTSKLPVEVRAVENEKTRSTYYTQQKVDTARDNISKYEWAESMKNDVVIKANRYVDQGLDFFWNLVTPQSLPRSYEVNESLGSPLSGKEIDKYGSYAYTYDPINDPWKIVDPTDGKRYPTNDFGAFYRSGLNEHGVFDRSKADRSLLYNEEYPDPNHPLHMWGVDDGLGWVDSAGNRYTFIAYYVHWAIWGYSGKSTIQDALRSLRDAYLYTGDVKYSRAGTVLLDRIADIYPSLDVSTYSSSTYLNSHGGTNLGKAVGSIWETFIVKDFLYAYDAFFPAMEDPELIAYLSGKSDEYELGPLKYTASGIRKNIEEGIVKQIYPAIKAAQIHGNNGMHQSALALAAVVYDKLPETQQWLDFVFQSGDFMSGPYRVTGGNVGATLINDLDRDGHGNEASPGYNRLWLNYFLEAADILNGYDLYATADLYQNPKFRKMFHALYPLTLSERYSPQIGDSGSTGNPGLYLEKAQMVRAFSQYGDPIFAQMAHFLNNNSTIGIRSDIFTPDPAKIAADIQSVIDEQGSLNLSSVNLTGYGFTALRDGSHPLESYGLLYPFVLMPVFSQTASTAILDLNGALEFQAKGQGDSIDFTFDVTEKKEYEIGIKPFRSIFNGGYGIYQVSIDGQNVAEIDFYGTLSGYEALITKELDVGTHHISFQSVGKHPDSSGYKMGLFEAVLLDQQEQIRRDQGSDLSTLRDLWMYYGRNNSHGHRDTLNIGLHAYGLDLSPDLGYPEYTNSTDPHRFEWMHHTVSHNTVMVDESKQQVQWVADPKHYDDNGQVKLIDVEAPKVYPQTELYKRTTAMIRVDDEHSYAVDFFRVKGGDDHLFSFHGAEGEVSTEGLSLTPQVDEQGEYVGTYAGRDVPFEQRPVDDSVAGSGYAGPGYHYLKNVRRDDAPASQFSVDWKVVDTWNALSKPEDIHLRLTMLGELDDLSLADGVPPRNQPGNPDSLQYVLAHRKGADLDSLFTSVIEPYKGERYIEAISPAVVEVDGVAVDNTEVKAVKVTLKNGRTDYLIHSLNSEVMYTIDGKLQFKGIFGVLSELNGKAVYSYVNDGTVIGLIDLPEISAEQGSIEGTVLDFTKNLQMENSIKVEMDLGGLPAEELVNRTIYVQNDGIRNAAYLIKDVSSLGNGAYVLNIGDTTFIRNYKDDHDFSKGFVYDISEAAAYTIPLSYEKASLTEIRATMDKTELVIGETAQLSIVGKLFDGQTADLSTALITYTSNQEEVATVSADGLVTARGKGNATITVQVVWQGVSLSADVTMKVGASLNEPGKPSEPQGGAKDQGSEVDNKVFVLTAGKLKAVLDGEKKLMVPSGMKEIIFPVNAHELLKNDRLELMFVEGDGGGEGEARWSLFVSAAWLQSLLANEASNQAKDLRVSLQFNIIPDQEASDLLGKAAKRASAMLTARNVLVNLNTNLVTVDGKYIPISGLDAPLTLWFKVPKSVNENILGVYFIDTDGNLVYINGERKGDGLAAQLNHLGKYALLEYDKSYVDVPPVHWAANVIRELSAKQIVQGVSLTEFAPAKLVTRAEFATLLVRLLKLKVSGKATFVDIAPDDWYFESVSTAASLGLVEGIGDNLFEPNDSITREQMATMLLRAYELKTGLKVNTDEEIEDFQDVEQISVWAQSSVKAAKGLGLVQGREHNRFVPEGLTQRVESAQAIYNLLQVVE